MDSYVIALPCFFIWKSICIAKTKSTQIQNIVTCKIHNYIRFSLLLCNFNKPGWVMICKFPCQCPNRHLDKSLTVIDFIW